MSVVWAIIGSVSSIPIWAQAIDTVLLRTLRVRGRRRLTFQNISAKQTFNNTQYTTKCRPIYHRQSIVMPKTAHRNITVEVSAECRPTYRPSIDRKWRLTVYHLEEHVDQRSTQCRSISRPSAGRNIGRVCRSRCRPSVDGHTNEVSTGSGNWRSTNLKNISTDARLSVGRYLAQVSAENSVEYRPSVGRDVGRVCGWSMSVEYVGGVSAEMLIDISADTPMTLDGQCWSILDR